MKEKIKWTKEKTKSLIKLKHSLQYYTLFLEAKNKPQKLQKTWQQLANDLGHTVDYDIIKIKYNGLLNIYRKFLADSKRSANGSIDWAYWETFNLTFIGKIEINPLMSLNVGFFLMIR